MAKFINWLKTEETEKTPTLDKVMLVGAVIEVSIILFFIAFLIKLGMWGMII